MWKSTSLFVGQSAKRQGKPGEEAEAWTRDVSELFAEHLDLYPQGIAEISTSPEHYPLHQAVFDNNLPLIRRICVGERFLSRLILLHSCKTFCADLNEVDLQFATPLMLAVKLRRRDCVRVLCDHLADPSFRPFPTCQSPIEYAVQEKDSETLAMLVSAAPRAKASNFSAAKESLADALRALPDLSLEMRLDCDSSFIPFLGSFAPSDVFKVYKRGECLRVDLTLVSWNGASGTRGNLSILFKGRSGSLLLVDHNAKTVDSAFDEMSERQIEETVDTLLKENAEEEQAQPTTEISLAPVMSWGKLAVQTIEGYECAKYSAKFAVGGEKRQQEAGAQTSRAGRNVCPSYRSFADYFADGVASFDFDPHGEVSGAKTCRASAAGETQHKATVWVCRDYPLRYSQFAPVIRVLSYTSPYIERFADFFARSRLEDVGFPLKLQVPLIYTMSANLTLANLRFGSVSAEFMNVDSKYDVNPRGCGRMISSPQVKLYSPISRPITKNVQSFAQAMERDAVMTSHDPAQDNDRLQWTSYESDENEESLLRAKAQYERLLNQTGNGEPDVEGKGEAPVVLEIVKDPDEDIVLDDQELDNSVQTAADNIKSHSIAEVQTLTDVAWRLQAFCTERNKTSRGMETLKRQKNEESRGRPHVRPQDTARTLKRPFDAAGADVQAFLLSRREKEEDEKTVLFLPRLDEQEVVLTRLRRAEGSRNGGEQLRHEGCRTEGSVLIGKGKKTADVDVCW